MAKAVCLPVLLSLLVAAIANPQSLVNVEVDSWVYPILDRFVAKSYIYVDTEARPLTRGKIAEALEPFLKEAEQGEAAISSIDRHYLARLKTEFAKELGTDAREGYRYQDMPVLRFDKGESRVNFDVYLEESLLISRAELKNDSTLFDTLLTVSTTSLGFETYGQLNERLAYNERLTFSLIEGDEDIGSTYSGRGTRVWKRGTAEIDRAYFKLKTGPIQLELGRDRFWWGPGRFGTLLVSPSGEPLDLIALNADLWRISARGFTAVLSPDEGIYLSVHRLSLQLPLKTVFGISEAVVYHRRSFPEPQYVNPIIPYYAAEHNMHQDDNTLWLFDLVTYALGGVRLYGEFLIDDVQYERGARAPDKLAGVVGLHVADPLGLPDSDLKCEYTRLNKWVYTHRDSSNKYVHSGTPIGEMLGPDSDRLILEISHRPSIFFEGFLRYMYLRHGEGTVDLSWEEELGEPRPFFPSGKVETCNCLSADVSYRPAWWLFLKAGVEYRRIKNPTAFGMTPEKPMDWLQWNLSVRMDI
ncbi:hypothetical protein E3J62_12455 [candidate division TA06 bacterium]|uniref:Capsule assembly Wzi family protein n=1 Tax=candidate division TA06 bacterium TaxID=2250710 RepID=A0A523UMK7_UNCT6|nr:MAG: hypothetical protein E3J62_12455 [candidate division TA06 bacterium]